MTVWTRPIDKVEFVHPAGKPLRIRTHAASQQLPHSRGAAAAAAAHRRFPVCREFSVAIRLDLPEFLDDLAMGTGWRAERLSDHQLVLEPPGALIECAGTRKHGYCSCRFQVWTASVEQFWFLKVGIVARAGRALITQPMFMLDWHFLNGRNELVVASSEELADDTLFDQAYPQLEGGVAGFVERYLGSRSAVLVLHGPPGTGKTRLIRAMLGALTRRLGAPARVMVADDACVLRSGQIYAGFLAGTADALIVEDAARLIQTGADGNEHLHRLLAIADGVARANGRKIILVSDLPDVGDPDAALHRPGRCFARVRLRELTLDEAVRLWRELAGAGAGAHAGRIAARAGGCRTLSLAEVYQAAQEAISAAASARAAP